MPKEPSTDKRKPDPRRSAEWYELPGQKGHPAGCTCWKCDNHRHTWQLAIERHAAGKGSWSREKVVEYGKGQAGDAAGDRGSARQTERRGKAQGPDPGPGAAPGDFDVDEGDF